MMTKEGDKSWRYVDVIPIDRIRVLNPRVRNRRNFREIVDNIGRVGLKRPITVSRRVSADGEISYDLVCGQGRVEAFLELGQTTIPALVIEAEERDCLVMSLVENCARRQHRAIDLLQEVGSLRKRGYNDREIGAKIGVSPEYVNMIASLLERGEERLVAAVETGMIPLSLAFEIAKADDEGAQAALADAYTQKKLRGKKLVAVQRILQQRRRRGGQVRETPFGRSDGAKRPLTSEALVRVYRQEADKQKVMIKKAEVTQSRLLFVIEAIRALRCDDGFIKLLRTENLETMPAFLEQRLAAR